MFYNKKIILQISIVLLIFLYQIFLYQNYLFNYFDYGILFNFPNKINLNDYSFIANDHISIIYIILKFLNLEFLNSQIYIILFIKAFCLSSIFLLNINKNYKFYIFVIVHPFIWNYINFSINLDFLFVPLSVFIINSINENNFKKLLFWSILTILVKDTFCIFLIPYVIIFFIKNKNIWSLYLLAFCLVSLILIFFKLFFFNDLFYSYNSGKHFLNEFNFKYLIIIILLIFCFLPILFSTFRITLIPLALIYLIVGNENLVSIYSHYNTYFIAPLLISINKLINDINFSKKKFLTYTLILLQISYSPFSIIFWNKYSSNLFYNIENKESFHEVEDFINKLNINDKIISIQNNLSFKNIYSSKYLLPYPLGVHNDEKYYKSIFTKDYTTINADLFIVNLKKDFYILDDNCLNLSMIICNSDFYRSKIYINKNEYKIIYDNNDFKIFKKQ